MFSGDTKDVLALLDAQKELLTMPADPAARTQRALHMLSDMLHLHGSIFIRVDEGKNPGELAVMDTVDIGLEKAPERPKFVNFYIPDPPNPLERPIMTTPGNFIMIDRREIMSDVAWHDCGFYTDISKKVRAEEIICVRSYVPQLRRHYGVAIFRPKGDPAFTQRDRQMLQIFYQQFLPIFRQKPARALRDMSDLAPRYRPIVEGLLAGDSPKQIAAKNKCSIHTVYVYIKQLYKQFNVGSRGEFLARWHARFSQPVVLTD